MEKCNFPPVSLFDNVIWGDAEEWKVQPNLADPSKRRTSTGQVQDKLHAEDINILTLIKVIGEQELSVKEMMNGVELKGRDNFLKLYLNPALKERLVRMKYPDRPNHPRQKYLLTVKGQRLYQEVRGKM